MKLMKILLLSVFMVSSLSGQQSLAKIVPDDVDVTKDELLERIMHLEFKMCVKDVDELEKQLDDGIYYPFVQYIWTEKQRPWDEFDDIKDKLQACTDLKEELEEQVSARCFDFVFCEDREEFGVEYPDDFEELKKQTGVIVD